MLLEAGRLSASPTLHPLYFKIFQMAASSGDVAAEDGFLRTLILVDRTLTLRSAPTVRSRGFICIRAHSRPTLLRSCTGLEQHSATSDRMLPVSLFQGSWSICRNALSLMNNWAQSSDSIEDFSRPFDSPVGHYRACRHPRACTILDGGWHDTNCAAEVW